MPLVFIEMLEGRTAEEKKKLMRGVNNSFKEIGIPTSALHIVIRDIAKHNIAIDGKVLSEI